jgi:hypothetical protein
MRLADHATLNFNNNMSTSPVFLDIEQAYDTTWHSGLLYKLSQLEFSISLIMLIAFFSSRKYKVLVEENSGRGYSRFRPCPSIVQSVYKLCPRGSWNSSCSVRGPYLYLHDGETRTRVLCKLQRGLTILKSWYKH